MGASVAAEEPALRGMFCLSELLRLRSTVAEISMTNGSYYQPDSEGEKTGWALVAWSDFVTGEPTCCDAQRRR